MGSRIRDNVQHFFECFCEVVPPTKEKAAWIIQQFPEKYKHEDALKSVPQFTYPYNFTTSVIQHYSFVLTDCESKWTFGFCRHDPKSETAIVVLSYLPWHNAFYKFLDNIAILMSSPRAEDLSEFLSSVYNAKIAEAGRTFSIPFNRGESLFTVEVPRPFQLPSIPENRNLTEYFAVDAHNMMTIFASMLFERRIIFTSKKLTRLSACVQSANELIYPMVWQHIFIPVLPMSLTGYLSAPMPFLIGVSDVVLKEVNRSDIGEVVILDADANTIESPFDDLNSLPQEVVSSLKKQLKNKSSAEFGDGVSRAFLRALVQLIGGYKDGLIFQPGEKITFDPERFIDTRPPPLQPFLREMLHLQIFQQFIEERLNMLNNGMGFSDEFELETHRYSEKSSSKLKQQYKEWTSSMKKEGTAFFKTVKDKANPAMKSAVKTVKDGGKGMKSAYKGLRSRLKENQGPQQLHNGLDSPSDKPRSAPNSPTGKRRQGFGVLAAHYRKETGLPFKSSGIERSYSPLSPTSQPMSPEVTDSVRSGSPILEIPRIDLMHEMQDLLQLHLDTPPVDRSLKPVRSLENFKHTSPTASPDRWIFPARSSAPMASPPSRFFLPTPHHTSSSQETQNLLQSPDDVFTSPPVPPRNSAADIFGTAPFVVGGGHSENGDPLFLVANQHSVDIVKLSPPTCSPRRKQQGDDTEDLIRLDSTSDDMDDFDPLKSSPSTPFSPQAPLSVSNPLYTYENHSLKQNGSVPNVNKTLLNNRNDQDLLQEYGLDFNSFSSSQFDPFSGVSGAAPSSNKVNSKSQWTKFD